MSKSLSQKRSQQQEKKVAEELGGKVQKGSGSSDFAKGDVRKMGSARVECKTTSKKSYALKLQEIQKITTEAIQGGMEGWAMQIEFQGQMGGRKKVAVIDWYEYLDLKEKASRYEGLCK